ncbi:MAG: hypothetical protein HGA42_19815, partial [Nostocales cyanobacterium W4_Combined_metabat2_030]|nr:hypothetical protein [Nostocales cyanobacterium W4_Combined_metabat2_030]
KKDGLLTSKPLVLDFLTELILDATLWLKLKQLTPDEKEKFFEQAQLTPAERYWYEFLLPQWMNESDPKLDTWKKKIMSGAYTQDDRAFINSISHEIEALGGACLWRYILDLSMATDLLISGNLELPLCVQITMLSDEWLENKNAHWEATLRYWWIQRGLLLSFNPRKLEGKLVTLAEVILQKGDELPPTCYDEYID